MLLIGKDRLKVNKLKETLKSEFEMKDLGSARKILRMHIKRNRDKGTLFLSQSDYLEKLVDKFSLRGSKPTRQPLTSQFLLSKSQCPTTKSDMEYMEKVPYPNAVGSVMYSMVCTRPDLAYAISVLSKFMSKPGKEYWLAI